MVKNWLPGAPIFDEPLRELPLTCAAWRAPAASLCGELAPAMGQRAVGGGAAGQVISADRLAVDADRHMAGGVDRLGQLVGVRRAPVGDQRVVVEPADDRRPLVFPLGIGAGAVERQLDRRDRLA